MRPRLIAAILFAGSLFHAWPQSPSVDPKKGGALRSRAVSKREVHVILDPTFGGSTLEDLARESALVVEGTVERSNLPVRQPSASHPDHIETDSIFRIDKLIWQAPPARKTLSKVVISEYGGTLGQLTVIPDEPLLQPGERMMLFLQPDDRTFLKPIPGLPRYSIVGIWSGKFKIKDGKIQVPVNSNLRDHHLEDHDVFFRKVTEAVTNARRSSFDRYR